MTSLDALQQLVSPEDLAVLDRLEMLSRRSVEGIHQGLHHSRMKGGSSEFAQHRAYTPGDELRHLDWRVAARADRYYVREFHAESVLPTVFVLDTSGSMRFGQSTRSKFSHARAAAACLARLLLSQRDPVGLSTLPDSRGLRLLPPRMAPNHFAELVAALGMLRAEGATLLREHLESLLPHLRRKSLLLVFSDGFEDPRTLSETLRRVRAAGHEFVFFHVLTPEELGFPYRDSTRFESLEVKGQHLDMEPLDFAETYLERMRVFVESLRRGCMHAGGDYEPLPTHQALGASLADYLHRRAERGRCRAASHSR
ncbi:MAG: hypothetical protein RLZZ244_566 [Verrucomicrobiota bacterium]